jgi:hypothetical protein
VQLCSVICLSYHAVTKFFNNLDGYAQDTELAQAAQQSRLADALRLHVDWGEN